MGDRSLLGHHTSTRPTLEIPIPETTTTTTTTTTTMTMQRVVAFFLVVVLLAGVEPVEAGKKNKAPRAALTAAQLMGSVSSQSTLSAHSHVEAEASAGAEDADPRPADDPTTPSAANFEEDAERPGIGDEEVAGMDKLEAELESDMGNNAASLAGAINMVRGRLRHDEKKKRVSARVMQSHPLDVGRDVRLERSRRSF